MNEYESSLYENRFNVEKDRQKEKKKERKSCVNRKEFHSMPDMITIYIGENTQRTRN